MRKRNVIIRSTMSQEDCSLSKAAAAPKLKKVHALNFVENIFSSSRRSLFQPISSLTVQALYREENLMLFLVL